MAALLLGAIAAFAISSGGNSGEPEVRTLSTTVTESEPETGLPASAAQEEAADSSASLEQPDFESVNGPFGFAEVPAGWIHEKQNERVGPQQDQRKQIVLLRQPQDDNIGRVTVVLRSFRNRRSRISS